MDCKLHEEQDDEAEMDNTSDTGSRDAPGGIDFTVTAKTSHGSAVEKAELPIADWSICVEDGDTRARME